MTLKAINELKQEIIQQLGKNKNTGKETYEEGMKIGINESFHSFSDLIAQYLKYQNNVKLLMSKEKNIWKKWVKYYEQQQDITKSDYIIIYNTWLFEYLFCNTLNNEEIFTSLY